MEVSLELTEVMDERWGGVPGKGERCEQRPSISRNPCKSVRRAWWSQDAVGLAGGVRATEEVGGQLRPAQANTPATSCSELNFLSLLSPRGVWLSNVSRATACLCLTSATFNLGDSKGILTPVSVEHLTCNQRN